jgi:hypothetical protein
MPPLTDKQVAELEATRSSYGCGMYTCKACNPIVYACDDCEEQLYPPIANGEAYVCPECGYDSEATY